MLNFEQWINKRFSSEVIQEEVEETNILQNRINQLIQESDLNTNSFLILQFIKTLKYKPDQFAIKNLSEDLKNISEALIDTSMTLSSDSEENIDKTGIEE